LAQCVGAPSRNALFGTRKRLALSALLVAVSIVHRLEPGEVHERDQTFVAGRRVLLGQHAEGGLVQEPAQRTGERTFAQTPHVRHSLPGEGNIAKSRRESTLVVLLHGLRRACVSESNAS